ncbi:MFS transporter [Nocardia sp. NPDC002869]|uniref:MFS transporter n=1 Tax=Nocardia sp. NPDC002869 TaxID=3161032 RepID=UPI00398C9DB1
MLWQDEFGFGKSTLTAVFCCYMAGMALALLVAGVTSDRLGRKAVLAPALVLAIAAGPLFAAAPSTLALFVARTLTGIASGAMVSAGVAAVTDYGPPPGDPQPDPAEIALPIHLEYRDTRLCFINAVTTFGAAFDITLAEIAVETYLPADAATARFLVGEAATGGRAPRLSG